MMKEIKTLVENNPLALATTNKDGNPHVIAVGDVKVLSDEELIIGDNFMRVTAKNIKLNPNVSLAVWENNKGSKAEGYSIEGHANYFSSGKFVDLVKKIHEGCPAKGAIVVKIKSVSKLC